MKKRWYVVNIYSGYEKQVISDLKTRIKRYKLETAFGKMIVPSETLFEKIIVPSETLFEKISGKIRKSDRQYYPGYILVEMELNDKTWNLVNETKRVVRFIGSNVKKPAVIKKNEFKQILSNVKKHIDQKLLKLGERIRVLEGPFAEFTGIVEEINYEKKKVKISVLIFGRSTPVEIDFYKVIKDI
ncbi:transcription termination/antitermination protein NusG [Candidatus Portiera aleyrodidarum]|uniref:Transcription termination/antitermination protein NusG n=3 Tax=Candidatus Portiera aleyrodidarum TaxID=91844 RepID=A0AAU8S7E8_9GAMM|nr:transcription termination/antitermination protein NusG [Candidatus Portiera aleyrodidarum]AFQ24033.1 transcription antitermination protein nusG [Candidatus Portiera aleyrodidarum BT-B-HRs]AFS18797.1 Transcription antitermination protein NusG [Candidatus Portiera aleyrodidarum BT-QVLC]AFT80423.1 Transcription antitermination protein NusG [Candidatus Portiera aleyrodidarum BT-QVLC]AFT80704.1 Transcription antitermination protein NusG [Candidatus Portiera aleyrodidarum BT-B-HRs]AJF24010.1 anti